MVTEADVAKIALLARLRVDESELGQFTKDFNAILKYIEKLSEVDVTNVEALSHVHGSSNIFRVDQAVPEMSNAAGLANAPEQIDGCFKVPLVIDQGQES